MSASLVLGLFDQVQFIFPRIQASPSEPETNTADERKNRNSGVVPSQQRIFRKRNQCLSNRRRECSLHKIDTHDETTHVLGRFAERVLQTGDGGEDFREGDQTVWNGLDPDIDGCFAAGAAVDFCVGTWRFLVDVVLDHSGGDHGGGGDEET